MQQRPYNRLNIIIAASAAIFLFGGGLSTLGSTIPEIKKKFALDDISVGAIFSILPFGILIGSLAFGAISDRFGYRMMLALSCMLMFGGLWGIAATESYFLLRISVLAFGVGGGAINGGTSALVADISERKAAALSLLGVFFGAGALSLPLIFATFQNVAGIKPIILGLSLCCLATGILILALVFPLAKQQEKFPVKQAVSLARQPLLLLIGFFLFCQSSFEALINNWTTMYFTRATSFSLENAIFTLSVLMVGMTTARLITGTLLRSVNIPKIFYLSLLGLLTGTLLIHFATSFALAALGMFVLGAALAGGFPIMLGLVGKHFSQLSGTAFSFVLVIALAGNMLINFLMGVVANHFGIDKLVYFCYSEILVMAVISMLVFYKEKKLNISF